MNLVLIYTLLLLMELQSLSQIKLPVRECLRHEVSAHSILWESSLESQVPSAYVFEYSRVIHGITNFDIMH